MVPCSLTFCPVAAAPAPIRSPTQQIDPKKNKQEGWKAAKYIYRRQAVTLPSTGTAPGWCVCVCVCVWWRVLLALPQHASKGYLCVASLPLARSAAQMEGTRVLKPNASARVHQKAVASPRCL